MQKKRRNFLTLQLRQKEAVAKAKNILVRMEPNKGFFKLVWFRPGLE